MSFACLVALVVLAPASAENLFKNAYFVNPTYQAELDTSIASETDATIRSTLTQMRDVGSAYWIDKKSKIRGKNDTRTLEGILHAASKQSPAPLVVAIVYDLPNRDCNAHASNGGSHQTELHAALSRRWRRRQLVLKQLS